MQIRTRYLQIHRYLACTGEIPSGYSDFDDLQDLCQSFVIVDSHEDRPSVPGCTGNPAQVNCPSCKCFKLKGCCPHVLAVNHMLKNFNVKHQLKQLPKKKEKHTRQLKGSKHLKAPPKALDRMDPVTESSDEEQEQELLALGKAGK